MSKKTPHQAFNTQAIHAIPNFDQQTGAVVPSLSLATTFKNSLDEHIARPFEYSRTQNPNRFQLEKVLATLEHGEFAYAFSSGLAAISTLSHFFKKGDHIIAGQNIYGGSVRYFEQGLQKLGVEITFVDSMQDQTLLKASRKNTKGVFFESPSNPLLDIVDIEQIAELAKANSWLSIVDNTFATPYIQNPLKLGIDVVVHSSTKYLSGHSDIVGGAVVTNRKDVHDALSFWQNAAGAVPSPFDCWLLLRSIKTLGLRMQRHSDNAYYIARKLLEHYPDLKVFYPGMISHPNHHVAAKQMNAFGGMLTIDLKTKERVEIFLKPLQIFTFAESLGCVQSLICYPPTMTHAAFTEEQKQKLGITEGLLRLSIGIEDKDDLYNDLKQGMDRVYPF